jgi:hypothetical protein
MRKTRAKHSFVVIAEVTILGLLSSLFTPYITYIHTTEVGFSERAHLDNILEIVHVFASSQDLVRCSDGKLVGSPGECPATDQCPPPQNNTISNCTPGELSNATSAESAGQNATTNETTETTGTEAENITTETTGTEAENITTRCFENRSTPHTPRCDDSSSSSSP